MPLLCVAPLCECAAAPARGSALLSTRSALLSADGMSNAGAGEAELVFCPYSYLLDPVVRAAIDVSLDNAVLIFDEAHNIGARPVRRSTVSAAPAMV
jgi:Rad3-related DNA helicase